MLRQRLQKDILLYALLLLVVRPMTTNSVDDPITIFLTKNSKRFNGTRMKQVVTYPRCRIPHHRTPYRDIRKCREFPQELCTPGANLDNLGAHDSPKR